MTARSVSVDVDRSPDAMAAYRLAKTIHRDGGNPAGTFGLLAKVVEDRSWERLRDVDGEPFGSFTAFVETPEPYGLGISRGDLGRLLALRHPREESDPEWRERAPKLREQVRGLLFADVPRANPVGTPGLTKAAGQAANGSPTTISASTSGNDRGADYFTARLRRDDPALHARVVAGELTPTAAARKKGWKPPSVQLRRPETVAQRIRETFTPEQIAQLIALLLPDGLGS